MDTNDLASWRYAPDVWRSLRSVNLRAVDVLFHGIGAGRLPNSLFTRIYNFGIPREVVAQTLSSIRSLDSWSTAWTQTAQEFLGASRRETSAGNMIEAERARYTAAMCYHTAQILELRNTRVRNSCRAWVASLTRQALPVVHPHARHLMVAWRDRKLPVLVEMPQLGDAPFGLVVLFNGVSQSKEETLLLAPRFLDAGYAVMSVDSPGTGEATAMGPLSATATDCIDAALDLLVREGAVDANRIVLAGASFGGNESVRIARRLSGISAVIAVTPPVKPDAWLNYASPIMVAELQELIQDRDPFVVAESFDITNVAAKLTMPVLVFGAGQDVVVPPNESQKLAQIVGDHATLVWYPELGHCLYAAADQWTAEAACWLQALEQGRADGDADATTLNAHGMDALRGFTYRSHRSLGEAVLDDDDVEYARLLPSNDLPD